MKSKSHSAKNRNQHKLLFGIGAFLALALIGCAGIFAYQFYQNVKPGKILSDALNNSGNLISSQDGFRRLKVGFVPTKPGSSISVEFDADGLLKDGTYKGSVKVNSAIFRVPLVLSGDIVGSGGDYYIKLDDVESSIKKAENENVEFKLYSSYVRQIATNFEGKWIKISKSDSSNCVASELVKPNNISSEAIQKLINNNKTKKSIIKQSDENVNGLVSYHLTIDEVSGEIRNVVGARCLNSESPKVQKIDVWVSKKDRQFTRIALTTDAGVYSIEQADSIRDSSVGELTIPTEFTTVDELKKLTEQIIGTPNN